MLSEYNVSLSTSMQWAIGSHYQGFKLFCKFYSPGNLIIAGLYVRKDCVSNYNRRFVKPLSLPICKLKLDGLCKSCMSKMLQIFCVINPPKIDVQ